MKAIMLQCSNKQLERGALLQIRTRLSEANVVILLKYDPLHLLICIFYFWIA